MKVFKKSFLVLFLLGLFLLPNLTSAQAKNRIDLNLFFSPTCSHCAAERVFLDNLDEKYSKINISRYDITDSKTSDKLLKFYKDFRVTKSQYGLVPATFISINGQPAKYYIGFNDNIESELKNKLDLYQAGFVESISHPEPDSVEVPLLGQINMKAFSPLVLSVLLGVLDGFNACAMVALGMLLTILIATGVRKKLLIIGGTFIFVSGAVYFLFISAWLELFKFLQYSKLITIVVAVLAILFALGLLKEYIYGVVCKICEVEPNEKVSWFTQVQRNLFGKLASLLTKDVSIWVLILLVAVIAAGINLVELFCSIGIPLAYTKILTTYGLSNWQYYGNLLVYILFYMLDDILVFIIAIFTFKVTNVSDKYLKVVKLVSAVVLLLLGLLLLFKPELLSLL